MSNLRFSQERRWINLGREYSYYDLTVDDTDFVSKADKSFS